MDSSTSPVLPAVTVYADLSADLYPPPKIASVQFTDLGAGLTVTFDKGTNRGGYTSLFSCSEIFQCVYDGSVYTSQAAATLGAGAMCQFTSTTSLTLTFGSGAAIPFTSGNISIQFVVSLPEVVSSIITSSGTYATGTQHAAYQSFPCAQQQPDHQLQHYLLHLKLDWR